jgi:hypothetical protein
MEFVMDPHSQYDERSHGFHHEESTGENTFQVKVMVGLGIEQKKTMHQA